MAVTIHELVKDYLTARAAPDAGERAQHDLCMDIAAKMGLRARQLLEKEMTFAKHQGVAGHVVSAMEQSEVRAYLLFMELNFF